MRRTSFLLWFLALDALIVGAIVIWLVFRNDTAPTTARMAADPAAPPAIASATAPRRVLAVRPPDALDELPPEGLSADGTWMGGPLWFRLLPATSSQRHRIVHLLWTPPGRDALAGTSLDDCPDLQVDRCGRLAGFHPRGLPATSIRPVGSTTGYLVVRDLSVEGADTHDIRPPVQIHEPFVFEQHLLGLHLALSWRAGTSATTAVVDLFSQRTPRRGRLTWNGPVIRVGEHEWLAEADGAGRLRRLTDSAGQELLVIRTWTAGE